MEIVYLSNLVKNYLAYDGKTILVKCRLNSIPQKSPKVNEKYISDVTTTYGEKNISAKVKIVIWKDPQNIKYKGSSHIWKLFNEKDLRRVFLNNDELLVKGEPRKDAQGVIWINITNLVILKPNIIIGSGELEKINNCERSYYLNYVKNIGGNNRITLRTNITRGNLVHKVIEKITSNNDLKTFFSYDMSNPARESKLRSIIDDVINTDYKLDFVSIKFSKEKERYSHRFIPFYQKLEKISDETLSNLMTFFQIRELQKIVLNAKDISCEVPLDTNLGLRGQIDLLIDNKPYEIKSSYVANNNHRIQISLYLLQSLINNETSNGGLIYTNPGYVGQRLINVEISEETLEYLIYLRHKVIVERSRVYLPSTYNRQCENCHLNTRGFQFANTIFRRPCQYYCQTERYWDCYTIDESGIKSQCKLFENCIEKEEFPDVLLVDRFNKMRNLLAAETEAIKQIQNSLDSFPEKDVERYGQSITDLKVISVNNRIITLSRDSAIPALDIHFDEKITIKHSNVTKYGFQEKYIAKFKFVQANSIIIEFETNLPDIFNIKEFKFTIEKQYFEIIFNRKLLKIIDFIQRSKKEIYQDTSDDYIDSSIENYEQTLFEEILSYNLKDQNNSHEMCEYFINYPPTILKNQISDIKKLVNLCERYGRTLVVSNNEKFLDAFTKMYEHSEQILKVNSRIEFPETSNIYEIGLNDSIDSVIKRLLKSKVVISTSNFVLDDIFFKTLTGKSDKYFFDFIIVLGAEKLLEAEVFILNSLAKQKIWVGDRLLVSRRYKSKLMKSNEHSNRYFSRLFERAKQLKAPNHYFFTKKADNINPVVADTFHEINYNLESKKKNVKLRTFIDIESKEKIEENKIFMEFNLNIEPMIKSFLITLKPERQVSPDQVSGIIYQLEKDDFISKRIGDIISIDDIDLKVIEKLPFVVDDSETDRFYNIYLRVIMNEEIIDSISELMLENKGEAETIIKYLKTETDLPENMVIISPYLAQVTRIRNELQKNKLEIPVGTPIDFAGESYELVIISTVCSNKYELIHWPLNSLHYLYSMLTMANKEIVLVGNKKTIKHIEIFNRLISDYENKDK